MSSGVTIAACRMPSEDESTAVPIRKTVLLTTRLVVGLILNDCFSPLSFNGVSASPKIVLGPFVAC